MADFSNILSQLSPAELGRLLNPRAHHSPIEREKEHVNIGVHRTKLAGHATSTRTPLRPTEGQANFFVDDIIAQVAKDLTTKQLQQARRNIIEHEKRVRGELESYILAYDDNETYQFYMVVINDYLTEILSLYYSAISLLEDPLAHKKEIEDSIIPQLQQIQSVIRQDRRFNDPRMPREWEIKSAIMDFTESLVKQLQTRMGLIPRMKEFTTNLIKSDMIAGFLSGAATRSPLVGLAVYAYKTRQKNKKNTFADNHNKLRQELLTRERIESVQRQNGADPTQFEAEINAIINGANPSKPSPQRRSQNSRSILSRNTVLPNITLDPTNPQPNSILGGGTGQSISCCPELLKVLHTHTELLLDISVTNRRALDWQQKMAEAQEAANEAKGLNDDSYKTASKQTKRPATPEQKSFLKNTMDYLLGDSLSDALIGIGGGAGILGTAGMGLKRLMDRWRGTTPPSTGPIADPRLKGSGYRDPKTGRTVKNPNPITAAGRPKSRAGLIIGLGAAAAGGLGLLSLFGGQDESSSSGPKIIEIDELHVNKLIYRGETSITPASYAEPNPFDRPDAPTTAPQPPQATMKDPLESTVNNSLLALQGVDIAQKALAIKKDMAAFQILQKTTGNSLKYVAKRIPGVSLGFGLLGAGTRLGTGDYVGAVGELLSGIASIVPGPGTALGMTIDGALLARDVYNSTTPASPVVPTTTATRSNMSNAEMAMRYFMSQGWSREQSAGIVGNLMQESTRNLNTNAYNPRENAQGIAQWRGDRLVKFKEIIGKPVLDADLLDQLKFVQWELMNSEMVAGRALSQSQSVDRATAVFDSLYERSSGKHLGERQSLAREMFHAIKPTPSHTPTLPPRQSGDVTQTGRKAILTSMLAPSHNTMSINPVIIAAGGRGSAAPIVVGNSGRRITDPIAAPVDRQPSIRQHIDGYLV